MLGLRKGGLLAALTTVVLLASGCPGGGKQETAGAPPAGGIRKNTANDNKNGEQVVDNKQFQLNRPAEGAAGAPPAVGAASAETPNPHPTGANWVYTAQLTAHVGDPLIVEYKLEKPNAGKAWVGLIPEAITATDEPANDAANVAYAYTVEAASATLNIETPKAGRFRLRLFGGGDAADAMLGETPVLAVIQWPMGDRDSKKAPYVTINTSGGTDKIVIKEGESVTAHFEAPAGYSEKAWLGVVPVSVKSPLEIDNDAADLSFMYLSGKLKDSFKWMADKPGTYVFRLFPSSQPGADYVAQSEEFTVTPKAGGAAK